MVFAEDEDYERYLEDLRELSAALEVRVYAYCLMTSHVHLLLGPGEEVAAMGRLMKALAARATRYPSRLEGRSGMLWEGGSADRTYLLACARYIELNPARARMAPAARDYAWSSFRQRMGKEEQWIDLDPAYLDLANSEADRRARYARFVERGVPEHELTLMREALHRGQLTGNQRFVDEVEQIIGCRI